MTNPRRPSALLILLCTAILTMLAILTGCDRILPASPVSASDYLPAICVAMGIVREQSPISPINPSPIPSSDICLACDGKGWNGDMANKFTCPVCGGTGKAKQGISAKSLGIEPDEVIKRDREKELQQELDTKNDQVEQLKGQIGQAEEGSVQLELKVRELTDRLAEQDQHIIIWSDPNGRCAPCEELKKRLTEAGIPFDVADGRFIPHASVGKETATGDFIYDAIGLERPERE